MHSDSSTSLTLGIIQLHSHSSSQTLHIQQQINLTLARFMFGIYYDSE